MLDTTCPHCGGPMISRKNGATGQRFWGCKNFPVCRGTLNTDGEAPRGERDTPDIELPSERLRTNDKSRWRHQ